MPTDKPRYTVIVDEEMLKRIDDFRFENRYPSRSAATNELIRLGLEEIEKEKKAQEKNLYNISTKNDSYLDNVYGEAAAFGGDSARIPVSKEALEELLRRSAKDEL